MTKGITFLATIQQTGANTTGIPVPEEVLDALGAGRRPPVHVTVNGHRYRSTVGSMGGQAMISLSAANRAQAQVAGGDVVDVTLVFDEEPRTVEVPAALAAALDGDADAKRAFEGLSPSRKRRYTLAVEGAKTDATRQRRIDKALAELRDLTADS